MNEFEMMVTAVFLVAIGVLGFAAFYYTHKRAEQVEQERLRDLNLWYEMRTAKLRQIEVLQSRDMAILEAKHIERLQNRRPYVGASNLPIVSDTSSDYIMTNILLQNTVNSLTDVVVQQNSSIHYTNTDNTIDFPTVESTPSYSSSYSSGSSDSSYSSGYSSSGSDSSYSSSSDSSSSSSFD